ncbi:MAG: glucose-6-phosphate dehydrogenase [Nitrospinota bacterium]
MECDTENKFQIDQQGQPVGPCAMVIFGASGDLTKRKLIPAIYNLLNHQLLPDSFAVVGVARSGLTIEAFREKICYGLQDYLSEALKPDLKQWLCERIHYLSGDMEQETYQKLKEKLGEIDSTRQTGGSYFYYLATAPRFFPVVVKNLGASGLLQEQDRKWRRVIIEKPFGRDLESARNLNQDLSNVMTENQVYRIDHYLGKETVQNILALRFANGIFEPTWNRRYVDHVQITVAESLGVEQRGGYYEAAGALRDMVPNHIFQLITLIAMEPPISFEANAVRNEQAKILTAIQPMTPQDALTNSVRGQYREGTVEGKAVQGYRLEEGVSEVSSTETFVALKLSIDNWRWAEVPFYLRTGKRLPRRVTEIAIQFNRPPFMLFRQTPIDHLTPNRLVIRIQPNEGISLSFGAKVPGPVMGLGTVDMSFQYKDYFGSTPSTGYERLLYDCMMGDATLFQRADMTEAGWSVVEPVLDVWKALPPREFPNYAAGSWGPKQADELLTRDGRNWINCS